MVLARFSPICQDWAAPLEITSTTLARVEPGELGEVHALGQSLNQTAMQIWLTILVSWPLPSGPSRTQARA